jgi:hypothetical protein
MEEGPPLVDTLYPDFSLPLASRDESSRPLCGAVPADDSPLLPGQKVAACNSGAKLAPGVPQEWILGTVLKQAGADKYMIGDDDDATGATVHTLARSAVVPLPLTEPPVFTRAHEHREGSLVYALFPDTTCFYKAKVTVAPSKRVRTAPLPPPILARAPPRAAAAALPLLPSSALCARPLRRCLHAAAPRACATAGARLLD